MLAEKDERQSSSADALRPQIGSVEAGRDFTQAGRDVIRAEKVSFYYGTSTPEARQPTERSPHTNGPAIRQAREKLGLSIADLAEKSDGGFDEVWLRVAEEGARVDRRQLVTLAGLLAVQPADITLAEDTRPPYRGLAAFEADDADLFGGRDAATCEIVEVLKRQVAVAVVGASGSGKSSVVKAGVVPRLRREGASWRILTMRPGHDPLVGLARALGSELDRDVDETTRIGKARERAIMLTPIALRVKAEGEPIDGKPFVPLGDFIYRIAEVRTAHGSETRVLLFVDQWEEVYTLTDDLARRIAFLDHLIEAFAKGPHRLILTMRADFTGRLLEDHRAFFERVKAGIFPLPRMSREELTEAIEKPARVVGLKLEKGLTQAILDDAGKEPGTLALVEFTLTELWKDRDKKANELSVAAYQAIGGLRGAIDRHADAVFEKLSPDLRGVARRALTRLVHVSTLESFVRTSRPLSSFSAEGQAIIQALADKDSRLVVISYDEELGEDVVEVAHEALIREWKKLHEWVSADPKFLQWRDTVEQRYRRWDKGGRRDDDLLQGFDLDDALSWLRTRGTLPAVAGGVPTKNVQGAAPRGRPPQFGSGIISDGSTADAGSDADEISSPIAEFVARSEQLRTDRDRERRETAARLQAAEIERETLARKNAEDKAAGARRFGWWVSIASVILAALGAVAYFARKDAQSQRDGALRQESLLLTKFAKDAFEKNDISLAALLAIQGLPDASSSLSVQRSRPLVKETLGVLASTIAELREEKRFSLDGDLHVGISGTSVSPNSQKLVVGSPPRLWDIASMTAVSIGERPLDCSSWSRDSAYFAAELDQEKQSNAVGVWDASDGHALQRFDTAKFGLLDASGSNIVLGYMEGKGKIVRLNDGRSYDVPLEGASLSADGQYVLIKTGDKRILYPAANPAKSVVLKGQFISNDYSVDSCGTLSAQWGADGKRLVTQSGAESLGIWEVPTGRFIGNLGDGSPYDARFDGGGQRVAISSESSANSELAIWNAIDGRQIGHWSDEDHGEVRRIEWSPDGGRIIVTFARSIIIFSTGQNDPHPIWKLDADDGESDFAFAVWTPDGNRIVVASWGGPLRLFDVHDAPKLKKGALLPCGFMDYWTAFSTDYRALLVDCRHDGPKAIKLDLFAMTARWQIPEPTVDLSLGPCGRTRRFSPNGRQVITVTRNNIRIWDVLTRELLLSLKGLPNDLTTDPVCRWSDDGQHIFLMFGSDSITVSAGGIWSATTGAKELDIRSGGTITAAEFSPNSEMMASANLDGRVNIWRVSTGRLLISIQMEKGLSKTIAWNPDSTAFVVSHADGLAHVLRLNGSESFAFRASSKEVNALAWGGEGDLIASSGTQDNGANVVTIWSTKNGAKLNEIGWEEPITHLLFGPNDHRLLGFNYERMFDFVAAFSPSLVADSSAAMLWDVERGSVIAALAHKKPLILNADFSEDGKYLATEEGNELRLWDAQRGDLLAHIGLKENEVISYWVGNGPRQIRTLSDANAVIEWHLPGSVQELIDTAKDHIGRCLSQKEQKTYYIDASQLCDSARGRSPAGSSSSVRQAPTSTP